VLGTFRKIPDAVCCQVMGHELAHAILNHGGHDWSNMASAAVVQLVVLSLLDSTGLGTLLFELFGVGTLYFTLNFKRYAFLLPAKRGAESEADALGLTLMAQARYSPPRAVGLFKRFKAFERAHGVRTCIESIIKHVQDIRSELYKCFFCLALCFGESINLTTLE
jgi:predicted Zn-dependent protease